MRGIFVQIFGIALIFLGTTYTEGPWWADIAVIAGAYLIAGAAGIAIGSHVERRGRP
jgi:hypothetical protein